jgi:hypothetical protein
MSTSSSNEHQVVVADRVHLLGVVRRASSDGVHSWAHLHAGSRPNLATFVDNDMQLIDTVSPPPLSPHATANRTF